MAGLELYIAFHTTYLLSCEKNQRGTSKIFLFGYIALLIISQTLALASQAGAGQLMWVEHRDFPGGPVAYFNSTGSSWNNVGGTVFVLLTNFMGDLILVGIVNIDFDNQVNTSIALSLLHCLGI